MKRNMLTHYQDVLHKESRATIGYGGSCGDVCLSLADIYFKLRHLLHSAQMYVCTTGWISSFGAEQRYSSSLRDSRVGVTLSILVQAGRHLVYSHLSNSTDNIVNTGLGF